MGGGGVNIKIRNYLPFANIWFNSVLLVGFVLLIFLASCLVMCVLSLLAFGLGIFCPMFTVSLDCPFLIIPSFFFERLIVLYLIGFSMGTLSIDGYNTEYRGFLPTNDTSKLELIFCCREDPNSTLSQVLPSTYPFVLLKVPVMQKTTNKQNSKKNQQIKR